MLGLASKAIVLMAVIVASVSIIDAMNRVAQDVRQVKDRLDQMFSSGAVILNKT